MTAPTDEEIAELTLLVSRAVDAANIANDAYCAAAGRLRRAKRARARAEAEAAGLIIGRSVVWVPHIYRDVLLVDVRPAFRLGQHEILYKRLRTDGKPFKRLEYTICRLSDLTLVPHPG